MNNKEVKEKTCEEEVEAHMESRIEDLAKLWKAEKEGNEEGVEDLGNFNEYGLCFDYVAPGTFTDQKKGYFRYQISYGGPQEEFRFYAGPDLELYSIEFWYLHWFDGAKRDLTGSDHELLAEIFDFFKEIGTAQAELDKSRE